MSATAFSSGFMMERTICPIASALSDTPSQCGNGIPLRMRVGRQFAVLAVVVGLLLSAACQKKTPRVAVNRQAPTLAVPVPEQIPEEAPPPAPPAPSQEAITQEPTAKKPPAKRKSKKTAQPPANQSNPTVAASHPPTNPATDAVVDTAIAADVTSQQLFQQKQTTNALLDSTEKNLKGLNRSLSHDEEIMVTQIRSYVAQSRKAASDGDFERAYNLAVKAHLLADALTKK